MAEQVGIERLTGLIAFARAGTLGSYSAAARSLSVSPSAISKSVQRLEQQLGIKLFIRSTRTIALTPEGKDLHERAVRLLEDAEALGSAAAATWTEPAGVLKVTTSIPLGSNVIAPALPLFRASYPKVSIDLRLTDRILDITEDGIDVAIRVGHLADSRLIALALGTHRVAPFASPGYLARRGIPLHPAELTAHDLVNFRFENSGQTPRWPFIIDQKTYEIDTEAGITANLSDAVVKVIASGGGIGITSTYVAAPYVSRGELVPVLGSSVDLMPISAVWSESRRGNLNVKAFVSFLSALFASPTRWDKAISDASPKAAIGR